MFKYVQIRGYEMGLLFKNGEFSRLLEEGAHWIFDLLGRYRCEVVSQRDPLLAHPKLDLIVKSGALKGRAEVIDLRDHERALVWVDNRFHGILTAGQYAYWTGQKAVRIEIVDARVARFEHAQFKAIVRWTGAARALDICSVKRDAVGVLFIDGKFTQLLAPGEYAFWKGEADARVVEVDLRETMIDVAGQEIMTADKVTLRVNAVVTYKVADARKAVSQTEDVKQALYRETQLVLRAIVGARELDHFLTEKDAVSQEIEESVRRRAEGLGLSIASAGVRDVILPGDMKELMNKVTEARKAAEANLISRREETAAIRSQANTARLLAESPTLMRLRELEVLEKIASAGKLNIVLTEKGAGDPGLAEKVVNLL